MHSGSRLTNGMRPPSVAQYDILSANVATSIRAGESRDIVNDALRPPAGVCHSYYLPQRTPPAFRRNHSAYPQLQLPVGNSARALPAFGATFNTIRRPSRFSSASNALLKHPRSTLHTSQAGATTRPRIWEVSMHSNSSPPPLPAHHDPHPSVPPRPSASHPYSLRIVAEDSSPANP
jgi:hypothetical protein